MSTLIDFIAHSGNKLDRTLGSVRNKVIHYTNGGGLANDVRAVRDLAAKPEVQGALAAAAVIGGTVGGFIATMKIASSICDEYGYDANNQVEPGMPGYNKISALVITGATALTILPITASTAYERVYTAASNRQHQTV